MATKATIGTTTVTVNRDSVAAGDDIDPHEHTAAIPVGSNIHQALQSITPEIRQAGWSWVATVSGTTLPATRTAVWSVDTGVILLPSARAALPDGPRVFWEYLLQIDAAWLADRLTKNPEATREELVAAWSREGKR